MFYEVDVVAGYIGSALYSIMFARRPIDVIGFINQSYLATNEYLICSALGHRLHLFYGDEVINGRKKDCEGRELGVTNRDYVFNFERDGDQLDELLDSLDEKWGRVVSAGDSRMTRRPASELRRALWHLRHSGLVGLREHLRPSSGDRLGASPPVDLQAPGSDVLPGLAPALTEGDRSTSRCDRRRHRRRVHGARPEL